MSLQQPASSSFCLSANKNISAPCISFLISLLTTPGLKGGGDHCIALSKLSLGFLVVQIEKNMSAMQETCV